MRFTFVLPQAELMYTWFVPLWITTCEYTLIIWHSIKPSRCLSAPSACQCALQPWFHIDLLQVMAWSEPGCKHVTCTCCSNKHFMRFVRCLTKIDKLSHLKFGFCCFVFYFPAVIGIAIKHCFCIEHEVCRRKVHIQPEKPCWSALRTVQEVKHTPTQVQDPKMKMKGVFSQRKTCQNLSCISVWTQQLQRRRSSSYIRRLNVIMSKTKYSFILMFHCPLWPPRQKPHSKQFSRALMIPYHLGRLPLDVFGATLFISVVFYDFGMDRCLCSLVLSLVRIKMK